MNLIKLLQKEVVEVTFTKLNGDERIMSTLVESFFPDPKKKKEATPKNDKVVAVWAIESKRI